MSRPIATGGIFAGPQAAQDARVKNELMKKLKENGVLPDEQLDAFKSHVVSYYDSKVAFQGQHSRQLRSSRLGQREVEEKFDNMYLHGFIAAVVDYIEKHVSNDRCIRVYEDVMSAIPTERSRPPASKPNPREKIETPFSVSRAAPSSIKSNAQLIETLASATGKSASSAISIRSQITWWDSLSGDGSGMLDGRIGRVTGGRLGRDHMLSDVPNHFVRDCLMNYINTQLEEDKREDARKAVFSDLTPDEIERYSILIMEKAERDKPKSDEELIARVSGDKQLKHPSERARVLQLGIAIDRIDEEIDLTPKPRFARRDHYREVLHRSVVRPGLKRVDTEEARIDVGLDIDRDCDQIRAMIARFTNGTEWTVDQFRLVLGDVPRPKLSAFLEMDGPRKGIASPIYALAWEFFKKREMLGYPLTSTSNASGVLQERDGNRGKRASTDGKNGEPSKKRTRRAKQDTR